MFTLYFTEEFLERIFLWVSIPLINLLQIKDVIRSQFIHKLLKDETIFFTLIASDCIEHITQSNEYPIAVQCLPYLLHHFLSRYIVQCSPYRNKIIGLFFIQIDYINILNCYFLVCMSLVVILCLCSGFIEHVLVKIDAFAEFEVAAEGEQDFACSCGQIEVFFSIFQGLDGILEELFAVVRSKLMVGRATPNILLHWEYNYLIRLTLVCIRMIRSNKRVPGTINPARTKNYQSFGQNVSNSFGDRDNYGKYAEKQFIQKCQTMQNRVLQEKRVNNTQKEVNLCGKKVENIEKWLPQDIQYNHILTFNISSNFIEEIPASIFNKLTNVTAIDLSNNRFNKISFPYFRQNTLFHLNISHNQLKNLNLEHVSSLTQVDCRGNMISFLSLPKLIKKLNCSSNQLSNIYFMQHCLMLQKIDMSNNQLYDLKFNFKPYIQFKQFNKQSQPQSIYQYLQIIDCSENRIQYIQGFDYVPKLKVFIMNHNDLSLSRQSINELLSMRSVEILDISNNPLENAGFGLGEAFDMIIQRCKALKTLNGHPTSSFKEESIGNQPCFSSSKKEKQYIDICNDSHFSDINDQPYALFMQSQRKAQPSSAKPLQKLQWNFTLGDCEQQPKQAIKLQQLSQIQIITHNTHQAEQPMFHLQPEQLYRTEPLSKADFQQTYQLGVLKKKQKDIKVKTIRSNTPLRSQHVFYKEYLDQLLPMSYVPAATLLVGAGNVSGKRLEADDDEFLLVERMFQFKGGIVYLKKINLWALSEAGENIFSKSIGGIKSTLGFLLKNIGEEEFRSLCKFTRLIARGDKDIIGLQPDAFSHFHAIVRYSPLQKQDHYPCAYLIQTSQI